MCARYIVARAIDHTVSRPFIVHNLSCNRNSSILKESYHRSQEHLAKNEAAAIQLTTYVCMYFKMNDSSKLPPNSTKQTNKQTMGGGADLCTHWDRPAAGSCPGSSPRHTPDTLPPQCCPCSRRTWLNPASGCRHSQGRGHCTCILWKESGIVCMCQ